MSGLLSPILISFETREWISDVGNYGTHCVLQFVHSRPQIIHGNILMTLPLGIGSIKLAFGFL
jgi:hypothetical protein